MPRDSDSAERKSWTNAIARYSAIGLMLPAATFVGWIIGALLDRWLHTTWLYLAGLIFGIAAGFVQLIRTVTGQSES
jgi:F0F1-type ATP synthase assembly protein I